MIRVEHFASGGVIRKRIYVFGVLVYQRAVWAIAIAHEAPSMASGESIAATLTSR